MPGSRGTMRGRFIPKNPSKYIGNFNNIMFRSSWERRFMMWLDSNNAILRWGSEELSIPYLNPVKSALRGHPVVSQYFPDFIIMYKDNTNTIRKEIVEVKPYKESVATQGMSERDKMSLAVNTAKWKAASIFAEQNGATFRVVTEKTLFYNPINKKSKK